MHHAATNFYSTARTFDHHKCNTNKQTNKCFIVNQDAHNEQYNQYKSQYTIDSQNNLFIG
jgi:hypothetical protein